MHQDQSRVLLHQNVGVDVVDILPVQAHALLLRNRVHEVDQDHGPSHAHVLDHHDVLAHVRVHDHVTSHPRKEHVVLHAHTVAVVAQRVVARCHIVEAQDVVPRVARRLQVGILMVLSKP